MSSDAGKKNGIFGSVYQSLGSVTGAVTIDINQGDYIELTTAGDCIISFTNHEIGQCFGIKITNSSSNNVTFDSSIIIDGTTESGIYICGFIRDSASVKFINKVEL